MTDIVLDIKQDLSSAIITLIGFFLDFSSLFFFNLHKFKLYLILEYGTQNNLRTFQNFYCDLIQSLYHAALRAEYGGTQQSDA